MSDWQRINSDAINQPRTEDLSGVTITAYLSNDDIPKFVKSELRDGGKTLAVRFGYNSSDDPGAIPESFFDDMYDRDTCLRIGKKSGRLYEIHVDRADSNFDVANSLDPVAEALQQLASSDTDSKQSVDNYRAAHGALKQFRNELATALTCP